MWLQNDRYLDRRGCGDEFYLDADLRASLALAALHDSDELDSIDDLDDADDVAAD